MFLKDNLVNNFKKIAKKHNLELFVLFGSYAKGNNRVNSDYDFAFIPPKNYTAEDEIKLFDDILKIIGNENIDLINLYLNHDVRLRYDIFHEGIPIYEKNSHLFKELKHRSWREYMDSKRFNKKRLKLLEEEIDKLEV